MAYCFCMETNFGSGLLYYQHVYSIMSFEFLLRLCFCIGTGDSIRFLLVRYFYMENKCPVVKILFNENVLKMSMFYVNVLL